MLVPQKRVKDLSRGLSSLVSTKSSSDVAPKRVHRFRVAIRRIESLVSFVEPAITRKEQKALRDMLLLRKRAGKVRDIDVQIALLGSFANGSTASDRRMMTEILKKKRARQTERLISAAKKLADSRFLSRIERIVKSRATMEHSRTAPVTPLERARTELAGVAQRFVDRAETKSSALHRVRIRLKKIRYMAELSQESDVRQQFLHDLKATQNALGDWHDWEELEKTLEKYFGDRVNCALLVEARSLLAAKHGVAVSAVGRLFASTNAPARKPPQSAHAAAASSRRA